MNNFIVLIIIIISLFDSVFSQVDKLSIDKTTETLNDSLLIRGKAVMTDSIAIKDTAQIIQDSLQALQQKALTPIKRIGLLTPCEFGTTLSRNRILFSDYRFTGDLINQSSLGFIRDLGMLGQPDEVLVYGAGFNNISYMQDGMSLNNRLTNSLDLNYLESESIDSIEIIPAVRGFLYGSAMNPVSVNFINKNNFTIDGKTGAYSRLRYYQASNEEAFIDAIFKTNITHRLIGAFEMTNESIDNRFKNSKYYAWKANAKLNYLLSDNFNLIGSYNYLKSEVHLFSGINIDSLAKLNTTIVSDTTYPVINSSLYQKTTEHNVYLKLVNNINPEISGELSAYYRFNLLEYRQNERGTIANEEIISRNHITKVLGGLLREVYSDNIYSADFIANYEKVFVTTDFSFRETQVNSASLSGKVSLKLDNNKLITSLFGKYLYFDIQSFYGFGGDVTYHFSPTLSLYSGISFFQKPLNIFEYKTISYINTRSNYGKITNLEAGLNFNYKFISISTDIFHRKINNGLFAFNNSNESTGIYKILSDNLTGIDADLLINIWKIYLEGKTSFYYNKFSGDNYKRDYLLPEFILKGGIFYKDTLFNSNLHLKTGIAVMAVGSQDLYSFDFETNTFLIGYPYLNISQQNSRLSPSIVFNFLLIGEIQDRAIIYFTFENLFDKQYYIVPYYLKQGRGIKLAVAWEFLN